MVFENDTFTEIQRGFRTLLKSTETRA